MTTTDARAMIGPLLLIATLLLPSMALAAIVTDVRLQNEAEGRQAIEIRLDRPMTVLRHFPRQRGRILQIQLDPGERGPELARRERRRPPERPASPLREVVFEGNVRGGPFLVLRFDRGGELEGEDGDGRALPVVHVRLLGLGPADPADGTGQDDTGTTGEDQAQALYRAARAALTRGDNQQAVLLFTRLLELPANPYSREALEYLGVARERNGQLEMARARYQDYLRRYPDSPRAATVRQRLLALETRMGLRAPPKLREGRREAPTAAPTVRRDHYARIYQILYNAFLEPERGEAERARQLSLTYADFSARRRSPASQWRTVFSGSYEHDFMARPDEAPGEFRLRSAYLDYQGKRNGLTFTLGRQSVRSGGVLGRFDGLRAAYRVHRAARINGVVGAPVDYLRPQRIQRERPLAGIGLELEEPLPHWNGNLYWVEQRDDGLLDRRAVGGDLRYFRQERSAFFILDYDLAFRAVNIATAHLGWKIRPKTRLNLHLDHRRSPLLTARNALQGIANIPDDQYPVLGLTDAAQLQAIKADLRLATLAAYLSEEAIRERALANTGRTDLVTLGLVHDFGPKVQINGNLNWTRNINVTPILTTAELLAAGPEPPQVVTQDISVNAQLILRDYLVRRDMFLLSAKLGDTSVYRIASASLITRRPLGAAWRLEARLRGEYTQRKDAPGRDWRAGKLSPALKVDYRLNKRLAMDGELGLDWYDTQQPNGDYRWTYFNLGLQLNF